MSHKRSNEGSAHPIMRLSKELYFSLFVLFYRIAVGWEGRMKASAASICVSVVEGVLVLTIWIWLQIEIHHYISANRWIIGIFFGMITIANDYLLVIRGHGIAFEKQFRRFRTSKKVVLYFIALGIFLAVGIAFYFLAETYHGVFHLVPPK